MGEAKSSARPAGVNGGEISEIEVDPARAQAASEPEIEAADERRSEQADLVEVREGAEGAAGPANTENVRGRVYANPLRPQNQSRAAVDGSSTSGPGSTGVEGMAGNYLV